MPRSEPGRIQQQDPSPRRCPGLSLKFILTGGERHDMTQAEELRAPFDSDAVIAGKGYDFDPLPDRLAPRQVEPVITSLRYRKQPRD